MSFSTEPGHIIEGFSENVDLLLKMWFEKCRPHQVEIKVYQNLDIVIQLYRNILNKMLK